MPLAGVCFPVAAFVCTCFFCVGRVLHQVRYSNDGYGAHAPGFVVCIFASATLEGLVLVAALRGAGVLL